MSPRRSDTTVFLDRLYADAPLYCMSILQLHRQQADGTELTEHAQLPVQVHVPTVPQTLIGRRIHGHDQISSDPTDNGVAVLCQLLPVATQSAKFSLA